jgi:glycosyltransferase involved in cell wall biosynthesis
MFNKLREYIYIQRFLKISLSDIKNEIIKIREKTDVLVVCPKVTQGNWLGVNIGTKSIFDNVFEIPQYYSNSVYSNQELRILIDIVIENKFSQVVFSGFSPYFHDLILDLKNRSKIEVGVIFHGALSELAYSSSSFCQITQLLKSGHIDKLGFVKKDLANYFNQLYCTNKCLHLFYTTNIHDTNHVAKNKDTDIHSIGVFGIHNFNKNTFNQVSAGLLIKNARIHVLKSNSYNFLQSDDRIVAHPHMPHQNFIELLSSMSVNTHISFSESWGQIVTESLAMGVPCLTSNNNGIFDFDDYLAEKLIVDQFDNPIAIAAKIKIVLEQRDEIASRGKKYVEKINELSKLSATNFLSFRSNPENY